MIQILMGKNITRASGDEVVWVHLIASEQPDSLVSSDMTIEGLPSDAVLAAGSTIRYPGGKAILYEDGGTFSDGASSGGAEVGALT